MAVTPIINVLHDLISDSVDSFQGFLTDLLKKANRDYDDKKLNEYTHTIVSS